MFGALDLLSPLGILPYMTNNKNNAKCENCGSKIPANRRDRFCSDRCTDDGYDIQLDMGYDTYRPSDWRWGSWDR